MLARSRKYCEKIRSPKFREDSYRNEIKYLLPQLLHLDGKEFTYPREKSQIMALLSS